MTAARPRPVKAPRDDQPVDFNLDAEQPDQDLAPFRFWWQSRRWEMQHLEQLDIWELVVAAEGGDIQAMTGAFKLALGKDWDAFHKTPFPQWRFKKLFRQYRTHCGYNADGSPMSGDDGM